MVFSIYFLLSVPSLTLRVRVVRANLNFIFIMLNSIVKVFFY